LSVVCGQAPAFGGKRRQKFTGAGGSRFHLERALDTIIRRVKRLDRAHDIACLARHSVDDTIVHIDRHTPTNFVPKGRVVETDRLVVLREEVQKTMIDRPVQANG
jgi:hypothetical protein